MDSYLNTSIEHNILFFNVGFSLSFFIFKSCNEYNKKKIPHGAKFCSGTMKLSLTASTGACRHQNLPFQSKKSEKDKKIKR